MKKISFLLVLIAIMNIGINAQTIKVLPLKKQYYNLSKEGVSCQLQNVGAEPLWFELGLEVLNGENIIGKIDDTYDLLPLKVTRITRFNKLNPGKIVSSRLLAGDIRKESIFGLNRLIYREGMPKDEDSLTHMLKDYTFRFRIIYGSSETNVNKVAYSEAFKLDFRSRK